MDRIPVAGPSITELEVEYVARAVRTAWYDQANVFNQDFEAAFAAYIGARHAVALPSCTSALHLSLLALGVGPGDEVVVPDITWIASSAPISYVGATPVFADIDARSWCLSPAAFEASISSRTRAVIVVDLYGNMPDMDSLCSIAQRHGIAVIEDAAEAIGSRYKGRPAGSLGDVGVFSFHGSKTLTTGEGGMLVTDRRDLFERVLVLRDHGRKPGDRMFFNDEVAYKYKMSSLQAALGLAQLQRIEELLDRKRQIFAWYRRELGVEAGLVLNPDIPDATSSYWMVTAIFDRAFGRKDSIISALAEQGIDSRPFFSPLSSLPAYRDQKSAAGCAERNINSYAISSQGVNLPSALCLNEADVVRVAEAVRSITRHR